MQRQTKTINLPASKAQVEVYEYITVGEMRQIKQVYTSATKVDVQFNADGKPTPTVRNMSADLEDKANDQALLAMVAKITIGDEVVEKGDAKMLETIMSLPDEDGKHLIAEINKITSKPTEKKTS